MKDIIKKYIPINGSDLSESCLRTFGKAIEKASNTYAKAMGAKIAGGKVGTIEIDNAWIYNDIVYNLESKTNINLDKGKSRDTNSELEDKEKVAEYGFRINRDTNNFSLISGIIVWSKPTKEEARKKAKVSLREKIKFGYIDFFNIFNVKITEEEYEDMIRRVWQEEIEQYFKSNQEKII